MIISRTPFRVSFFGGGTDYPVWYRSNGGSVLSSTIDKYCFISARVLPPFFDYRYRVRYYEKEETGNIDEIRHPSVRESLKFSGTEEGVDIVHHADLPAMSGLGSSSTFTVGLLNALYALKGYMPTKMELADNAIHVEQCLIGESVGSQDQVAAAFGGFNRIDFDSGGARVSPIIMGEERRRLLENNLMLFFSGFPRSASEIACEQIRLTPNRTRELHTMTELLEEAFSIIRDESRSIDDFGRLIGEHWKIKRSITDKISDQRIDEIYEMGVRAGALGGKLLGAGGGGFLLFYVQQECQPAVRSALSHLLHVPFSFDHTGSQIVYYSHNGKV